MKTAELRDTENGDNGTVFAVFDVSNDATGEVTRHRLTIAPTDDYAERIAQFKRQLAVPDQVVEPSPRPGPSGKRMADISAALKEFPVVKVAENAMEATQAEAP